jgi:hypothetical protein
MSCIIHVISRSLHLNRTVREVSIFWDSLDLDIRDSRSKNDC